MTRGCGEDEAGKRLEEHGYGVKARDGVVLDRAVSAA
jgi:hypothetical protein